MPTVEEASGDTESSKLCDQCNHLAGKHLMHANVMPYPTDGWITCPVAGCECYATWSVDEASREPLERFREEYFRTLEGRADESPAT